MKWVDRACFFMICTNDTEGECLDRGLFGDQEWLFPYLQVIKKGDIGFLINVSNDEIIGVFEAVEPARLNIVPEAWGGKFPAQINVKLITKEHKRIDRASFRLKSILELREVKRDKFAYKIPKQKAYGPDVTNKVLESFGVGEGEKEVYNNTPHFYSLPQGERKLKRNSRKEEREDFNKPLTLTLSRRWRGRKSEIFLTAPLTFVLSRKGREGIKEKICFILEEVGSIEEWARIRNVIE
jgi:hypothetical protein